MPEISGRFPPSTIQALMVDVDGVLVRGRPADGRRWDAELEADLGLCPMRLHEAFFVPHWPEVVVGRAGLMERLRPVLADVAPHLSADELVAYWLAHDARLDDKLVDALVALRQHGIAVHLATNQDHLRASYLWRTLGLSARFDGLHYSAALGCRKPEPAFFRAAEAASGFQASQLLLIEDSADNIAAARTAGWSARLWHEDGNLDELLGLSSRYGNAVRV